MAKTVEKESRFNSAAIVRELRGPLPEDDPFFEEVGEGQYVLRTHSALTDAQRENVRGVLRDLHALPEDALLTMNEVSQFVRRLPGRARTWTSARTIREARGPFLAPATSRSPSL